MDVLPRPMTPDQAAQFKCWSAATHADRLNNQCLGPQCMAWRWVDQTVPGKIAKKVSVAEDGVDGASVAPALTHGVCGHMRF